MKFQVSTRVLIHSLGTERPLDRAEEEVRKSDWKVRGAPSCHRREPTGPFCLVSRQHDAD